VFLKGAFYDLLAAIAFDGMQCLEHDPEKWTPASLATNAERVCAEIMLKQ
jgi:hypothetical protein